VASPGSTTTAGGFQSSADLKFPLLISFFFLICLPRPVSAQWVSDSVYDYHVQKGIDYTYNLDFEHANQEYSALVKLKPENPAGYFFLAMVDWWKILLDLDDDSHDDEFFDKLDKVIDMCDERLEKDENDMTALFFKGGAIGFRGRLHANRNHWLRAANDGRQAIGIVQKAYELQPDNADILLGIGIYNYYAEVAPNKYPLLKPLMWFLPKGDTAKGIEQLQIASQHAKYARVEATYFLAQLYFYFQKNYPAALQLASELSTKYPNNSLFQRMLGRCDVVLNHLAKADTIYSEVIKRYREDRVGYNKAAAREAYYYIGMYCMSINQPQEALKQFSLSERLSREIDKDSPSGYMAMAVLRMGMAFDLVKRREDAVLTYKRVLAMKEYEDSHKLAELYLDKPYGGN
jgi:tetratricopeptide (TPR) repeat protein